MTSTTLASTEPAEPAAQTAPDTALTANRPLLGVLFIAVATLLFATNDTANKLLVTDYNVPLVAAVRYIVHALRCWRCWGQARAARWSRRRARAS